MAYTIYSLLHPLPPPSIHHFDLLTICFSAVLPNVIAICRLNYYKFCSELQFHPNQDQAHYVLQGILHGFRIGFDAPVNLKQSKKNKPSAYQHPVVIDAYLNNEIQLGRVAGPFDSPPMPSLHTSSFGVIPKKGQPGKWRLIIDLSSPHGHSINDGIDPAAWSLHYIKIDDVVHMLANLGKGALIAKFDIESAFRNIPVHHLDRHLLGMTWRSKYYVDLMLPFGLRSAPCIFNSVADMVEWILIHNHGIKDMLHYLDDFILAGPSDSPTCSNNFKKAIAVTTELGLPLHPQKCVGPATSMVVLGIELDTVAEIARLPSDKLSAICQILELWSRRKWCIKKDLQSLIGTLHHACKVAWPGRTFLRRMIDLLCCFRNDNHPIRLNIEFKKDLAWWKEFSSTWNGVSFFLFPGLEPIPAYEVGSDASGTLGYGAFMQSEWFNGSWLPSQLQLSIAYKELFPVVLSAHIWSHHWSRKRILFRVDNEAVVYILNSRTSKDPNIMHLLRNLLLLAARHHFSFSAIHVPGIHNGIADALSRFNWQAFRSLAPSAHNLPVQVSPQVLAQLSLVI